METMSVPQGDFELCRYSSLDRRDSLRAWDAADEYLLTHLADEDVDISIDSVANILLVNDGFGALRVGLSSPKNVSNWGDSVTSNLAINANANRNGLANISVISGENIPRELVDVLVLKIPKHNALLEDQLRRIRPCLHPRSVVVAGGMTKHIHNSTIDIFQRVIGATTTTLARKKSRLIQSIFDPSLVLDSFDWPVEWAHGKTNVVNFPGVFSARSIDIGTRFLLEHLPALSTGNVVDFGCGNGVLGATFLLNNPSTECLFLDESFAAIRSAKATAVENGISDRSRFAGTSSLETVALDADSNATMVEHGTVDLVLNNPPFHSSNAMSKHIAQRMFEESARALKIGGELRVVANRHLGYHVDLKRRFGNCSVVASNKKFVILKSMRSKS